MTGLLGVSEALGRLLGEFSPVDKISLPLGETVGRVLAQEIIAVIDLPPFANSSMDGFAVQSQDIARAGRDHPVVLQVIEDIPAGQIASRQIEPGQAARIMTGAPIPSGADAVVPVEETSFNDRRPGQPAPAHIEIYHPARPGDHVRPRGQDIRSGALILLPGIRLRPQDVALLAMLGMATVTVYRKPRVAVLSTGDELLPVGIAPQPGKIYDSNALALGALAAQYGAEPISLGIAPDRAEAIEACLEQAADLQADLILSSAGVSVGAFDFVRTVVERRGRLNFWRVNMRPGKPLAFGAYRDVPLIGLPGNPVSAFVGFEVFVRPALLKLAGLNNLIHPTQRVTLAEPVETDGRESYLRAVVEQHPGRLIARLTGHQGSGNLLSLVQANALLIVPSEVKSLPSGAEVDAWLFGTAYHQF